jgi:hypothetical protein
MFGVRIGLGVRFKVKVGLGVRIMVGLVRVRAKVG